MATINILRNSRFYLAVITTFAATLFFSQTTFGQTSDTLASRKDSLSPAQFGLDTIVYSHSQKLEEANKIFARWQSALAASPDTTEIKADLAVIDSNIAATLAKVTIPQYLYNLRFLRGNLILTEIGLQQLDAHEKRLKKAIKELIAFDNAVQATGFEESYAMISKAGAVDTGLAKQHATIVKLWMVMKQLSNQTISQLNPLQVHITKSYIKTEFAHTMVQEGLKEFNRNIYSNPSPLISTPRTDSIYMDVKEEANFSFAFIGTMIKAFASRNRTMLVFNVLLLLVISVITFNNHQILHKQGINHSQALELAPLISTKPIGTALTIGFFFSPLLYRNVPAVVTELLIIGELIGITILLWKRVSNKIFWRWIALCLLFLRFGFMNLLVGISWEARWGLVSLNAGSIYIIWSSNRILIKERAKKNWIRSTIIIITILQQFAAIVLNFAGYPDAALMQSVNSIFNLTLAIAIILSIQIIGEFLNTVDLRLLNHQLISEEQVGQLKQKAQTYLVAIGLLFWILGFLNTLNYDKIIFLAVENFLTAKQQFGSTTFTYGNILTFALVFLASIWLSQISSVIIDLFSTKHLTTTGNVQLKNGKLFLRLSIMIAGLVAAFIASGIPPQQLAIILGALSVGIGLGLQHVVNNLVSGIIIAIEKPIKVGDVITIGNATGTVAEVGLRSTIITGRNGLKIYIPNGEFLSSSLFNQTTLKGRRAISASFLVAETTSITKLRELVNNALAATQEIMTTPAGTTDIISSTDKGLQVQVSFWIARNASETTIRDAFYANLVQIFQEANIHFGSRSRDTYMDLDED